MELAAAQIRTLAQSADKAGCQEIVRTLSKLQSELEDPMEILMRLSNFNILIAMFRVAVDVQLFQTLDKPKSSDVDEIAKATGVSSERLPRMLRYLASMNIIEETPNGKRTANKITRFFANSQVQGQVLHGFETNIPVARELFGFLAATEYRDITDNKNTPF